MKYITVFCSAMDLTEKYTKPAEDFARLLVKNGYHLVWGGTDKGLMKKIAVAVKKQGGKLYGISIPIFKELARKDADEIFVAPTLGERKATMLKRGDAIVALVGGIGTLDEITEIIELKKQKEHNKPVVILNTENFYEGLKVQLQKMKDDGFIQMSLDDLVYFADKPQEAIDYINRKLLSFH
ncbi:TIGR00730 family Rossman fold protein [Candidatus Microgenomates bacterium]|nr:TIGR00730 family Rossman fold protein [Candidatus Microgenomates bacterium]